MVAIMLGIFKGEDSGHRLPCPAGIKTLSKVSCFLQVY